MKTKTVIIEILLIILLMIAFFSAEKNKALNTITLLTITFFYCKNSNTSYQHQSNRPKELK